MRNLTAEELRNLVHYDPLTGVFAWLPRTPELFDDGFRSKEHNCAIWNARYAGKATGCPNGKGYLHIIIWHVNYDAHLLAWLYMTGEWPSHLVDHEDRDPANNRWANLREATRSENAVNSLMRANNTSGFKGACRGEGRKKWQANIRADGKLHYLGSFDTPEAAHAAYCEASKRLHGEFSRVA